MTRVLGLVVLSFSLIASAQEVVHSSKPPAPNQAPPRSDQAQSKSQSNDSQPSAESSSSSKDIPVDLSPPQDDEKTHPNSNSAVQEAEDAAGLYEGDEIGGVQEFRPWNPHKAQKDVEVGDFYFKRKNYRAALDRYREALYYKYDDAVATFRLSVCEEKLGEPEEARKGYEAYLKILPSGPFAEEAKQSLARLAPKEPNGKAAGSKNSSDH